MDKINCIVIKRDGTKRNFNGDKIRRVLRNVANEINVELLNETMELLCNDIAKQINGDREITTNEINDIIEKVYMDFGMHAEARAFILYRQQNKIINSMSEDANAMAEYVFMSRYSRYISRRRRRETWDEAVDRVKDMHIKKYPMASEDIAWAFEQVRQKRVLPSMRSMQFGGEPIEDKNSRMYNCTYSPIDRPEFFKQTMYLLLTGCGVGFSVELHNIEKLPIFKELDKTEIEHIVIEDSIEGWSDAIDSLIQSYINGTTVEFIYRKIRSEGSKIRSGGKAPGHVPLRRAIEKCRTILDTVVERDGRLKPIEAYDIVMHIADAVLSGGVRRSATICLFSAEDDEMINAKTGNWFNENPQRARSNNSVKLIREQTTRDQFMRIFNKQKEFGEPGFYFAGDKDHGTNPCLTGDTLVTTDKGEVRIDELIKDFSKYKVFTYNIDTGEIELENIVDGAMTRINANVIELELDDGNTIKLTPDHQVYTENRGWICAAQLTTEDTLIGIDE